VQVDYLIKIDKIVNKVKDNKNNLDISIVIITIIITIIITNKENQKDQVLYLIHKIH
jgi:hypothetical protein